MPQQSHLWLLPILCIIVTACGSGRTTEAPAPAPGPRPVRDYDQLLRTAQSYLEAGKPDRGADVAQRASAQKPTAPEPHVLLGRALAMQNQLEKSAAAYEKARELGSDDRRMFLELASVYDVSQRYDEAVAIYRAYLTGHPDDAEMFHELGLTLVLLGHAKEGVEALRNGQRLAPDDLQLQLDLGFGLLQAKQLDEAAEVLQGIIDAKPDLHLAIQFLAQVRAAQGRTDEALKLLDRAVSAGRSDPRPVRLRAQLRVVLGDHAGALRDYQLLVKANPGDAGALVGAAGALIKLDRLDEADRAVKKLRGLIGDKPQVAFRAAQIAWRQGDKKAVAVLEKFAAEHPAVLEAWRELVSAAKGTGNKALEKKARAKVKELEKK